MYEQGLRELSLFCMEKTLQGHLTALPKEGLWRWHRLFLEVYSKRVGGNGHKWQ